MIHVYYLLLFWHDTPKTFSIILEAPNMYLDSKILESNSFSFRSIFVDHGLKELDERCLWLWFKDRFARWRKKSITASCLVLKVLNMILLFLYKIENPFWLMAFISLLLVLKISQMLIWNCQTGNLRKYTLKANCYFLSWCYFSCPVLCFTFSANVLNVKAYQSNQVMYLVQTLLYHKSLTHW